MNQEGQEDPIYRLRPGVGPVLCITPTEHLFVHATSGERFRMLNAIAHPNAGEPTYLAEFWGGSMDGLRWFLEPGWYERWEQWACLAEPQP
jgi:hypothetical protein